MQKILYISLAILLTVLFTSCETTSDSKTIINPKEASNLQNSNFNLRASSVYEAYISVNKTLVGIGDTVEFKAMVPTTFEIYQNGRLVTVPLVVKTYTWEDGDGNIISNAKDFNYTFNDVGSFEVSLVVDYEQYRKNDLDRIIITVGNVLHQNTNKVYKTGQSKCYDYDTYQEETCTQKHRGQDGYYQSGLDRSYSKNGSVVIDNSTGLTWQDNADSKNLRLNWSEAVEYCQNLSLGGYNDWRIPTREELVLLVNYGKLYPAIDNAFYNTASYLYWSSGQVAYNNYSRASQWVLFAGYGIGGFLEEKNNYINVRCVR